MSGAGFHAEIDEACMLAAKVVSNIEGLSA